MVGELVEWSVEFVEWLVELEFFFLDSQSGLTYPMHRISRHTRVNFKGTLPTLILEALEREPTHGYRITQQIKERSKGVLDFKEGTLYPALHKLENEGLVESFEGVEKGRPRRYYRLTESGRKVLAKDRAEWRQLSQAVTMILGEA